MSGAWRWNGTLGATPVATPAWPAALSVRVPSGLRLKDGSRLGGPLCGATRCAGAPDLALDALSRCGENLAAVSRQSSVPLRARSGLSRRGHDSRCSLPPALDRLAGAAPQGRSATPRRPSPAANRRWRPDSALRVPRLPHPTPAQRGHGDGGREHVSALACVQPPQ